jgi:hypothetical protein
MRPLTLIYDDGQEPKNIPFEEVLHAFNGSDAMTIESMLDALGLGDSDREALADAFRQQFGIVEQEVFADGKRGRALVRDDFAITERGHTRGTVAFLNQRNAMVEKGLGTRSVLDRLMQVAKGLREDEPNAAERLRRLEAAIEVEWRCTFNMGDR